MLANQCVIGLLAYFTRIELSCLVAPALGHEHPSTSSFFSNGPRGLRLPPRYRLAGRIPRGRVLHEVTTAVTQSADRRPDVSAHTLTVGEFLTRADRSIRAGPDLHPDRPTLSLVAAWAKNNW